MPRLLALSVLLLIAPVAAAQDPVGELPRRSGGVTLERVGPDVIRLGWRPSPTDGEEQGVAAMLLRRTQVSAPHGWDWIRPELRVDWSSDLPRPLVSGSHPSARGVTARLTSGIHLELGPASLTLAPELYYVENREFDLVGAKTAERSAFLPPWRFGAYSGDLPVRFGTEPLAAVTAGESTFRLAAGPVAVGASTASRWWGPGVRNAIVLSDNAQGIAHMFAETAHPVRTPLGEVEAVWIAGGLSESLYFDNDPSNDLRALSAAAVSLRLTWDPNLSVGAARAVFSGARDGQEVIQGGADVLTRWSAADLRGVGDRAPAEQITSVFAQWRFPASGLTANAEWAQLQLPRSLEQLLTAPHRTQGYTLGLEWLQVNQNGAGAVRFQAEATNLEQSGVGRSPPPASYYVSETIPQGYTHRGRSLGAAIGPGASSQWLALDYLAEGWSAGVFGTRVRWDNDAYYTQPVGQHYLAHDVSLIAGVRGGRSTRWVDWRGELTWENRLNYLFQNTSVDFHAADAVDVRNLSLQLTVTPRLPR